MNIAEAPPALPDTVPWRGLDLMGELRIAVEEMAAQDVEHARYRDEERDAFVMDGLDEVVCLQARVEVDFRAEKRRNPEPHELAEDVTEGQSMQEAQRMYKTLVAQVLLHFLLDGCEARQDVAMGVNDTFGLGGGAG